MKEARSGMRTFWRAIPAFLAVAVVAAACGGSGTAQPSPTTASGAAANPCGIPVTGKCSSEAQSLSGAGATFPAVIYTKWIDEYNKVTGVQVNYQAIGSGGGIKGITDKTVDFGATDNAMTDQQLTDAKSPILHLPAVMGGIVATYNVAGVTGIKLTAETLSGIFLGDIKKWNDPKLATDNPGITFPAADIVTVHRSDGSGTTAVFTDYLSKVNATWKSKVGAGQTVEWPGGVGGKGNDGVAGAVKSTPNSIGYVELIYALQQKLGAATLKNAAGKFVDANLDSVGKAAVGVTLPDDLRASLTNSSNADAYPIVAMTYLLTYKDVADKGKALAMARYFWWGTHEGQAFAKDLGYAPLPADVLAKVEAKIRSMTSGGQAVLPAQ
ncbi:MAG: phosphate transport system substrate-binding protein [Chloroflexota bacterium]|nr:phosphate transport system substrate-binding protein [Chloroflexota bacterium]